MYKSQELKSNMSLLSNSPSYNNGSDAVCGFVDAIEVQRPLRSLTEARCASEQLNQVMACVEYGLELSDSEPVNFEAVNTGIRIIMQSCLVVSLRIEQFLDMQRGDDER